MVKKKTQNGSENVASLYADATARIEAAGLSKRDLSPEVAILALNDAATVTSALDQDFRERMADWTKEMNAGRYGGTSDYVDSQPGHVMARNLDNMRYDLSRSSRRRTVVAGLALGSLVAGSFLYVVGRDKAHFDKTFYGSGERVTLVGDPILPDNNLVRDKSIMPGDTWHNAPIIGPIVRNIPGVPDFGGTVVERKVVEYIPGTEKLESVSEGYTADRSENPVAPDLSLTGVEYGQGREAAKRFIDVLESDKGFTEDSIVVEGEVSDEYNGLLGVVDPEQVELQRARGDIALQALRDEAAGRGYVLPGDIAVVPKESVLTHPEVAEIVGLAENLQIPLAELLGMYNSGTGLPDDVVTKLDEKLAQHRGAKFTAVGVRRSTQEVTKLIPTDGERKAVYDDIPGEGVFAFVMLAPAMYGLGFSALGQRGRAVRRKARRKAKKAGLPLD